MTTLPEGNVRRRKFRVIPRPTRSRDFSGRPSANIDRAGLCWMAEVSLNPLTEAEAAEWDALETVRGVLTWPISQPGITVGSPGTVLVSGAGQLGSTINLDGFTAGYTVQKRQFLPIITGGRRYLYRCTADTTADGLGVASVPIWPPLRVAPADNDTVEIASPKMDGLVEFDGFEDIPEGVAASKFIITERG